MRSFGDCKPSEPSPSNPLVFSSVKMNIRFCWSSIEYKLICYTLDEQSGTGSSLDKK